MKYLIKHLTATDEYVVRVFDDNGNRQADRDYYTPDKDDAEGTRDAMREEDAKRSPCDVDECTDYGCNDNGHYSGTMPAWRMKP